MSINLRQVVESSLLLPRSGAAEVTTEGYSSAPWASIAWKEGGKINYRQKQGFNPGFNIPQSGTVGIKNLATSDNCRLEHDVIIMIDVSCHLS